MTPSDHAARAPSEAANRAAASCASILWAEHQDLISTGATRPAFITKCMADIAVCMDAFARAARKQAIDEARCCINELRDGSAIAAFDRIDAALAAMAQESAP